MTDRHNAYIVILESDLREDDAEETLVALRMVKGVMKVTPHVDAGSIDMMVGAERELQRIRSVILDALWPSPKAGGK